MNERNAEADLEDLSARSRRGVLTETDRRDFEQALARNPGSLLTHQLGCDFDRVGAVRPRDDELIARVVAAVVRAPRQAVARRSQFRWGLALAATFAAASAGAAWWSVRAASPQASSPTPRSADATALARPTAASRPAAPASAAPPRQVVAASPPSATVENRIKPLDTPGLVNAKTLFRDANLARKDGDFGRAMQLYGELERKFPKSEEAELSHVSMGKLLLSVGRFAEAERRFSGYLAKGDGPLSEEAWVGRAQSFQARGRAADERWAWRELLQRFPSSVYAERARQRLAEAAP